MEAVVVEEDAGGGVDVGVGVFGLRVVREGEGDGKGEMGNGGRDGKGEWGKGEDGVEGKGEDRVGKGGRVTVGEGNITLPCSVSTPGAISAFFFTSWKTGSWAISGREEANCMRAEKRGSGFRRTAWP